MAGKLIIVSNRLPVNITEGPDGLGFKTSAGGMAAALNPLLNDKNAVWVGWNGMARALSSDELTQLTLPKQLCPLNLSVELYQAYYYHFSNGTLWPICHGFEPRQRYDATDWQAVGAVTQQFADAVMAIAEPDDLIWVHDFHLVMLPHYLRERGCKNRIGYFLHIPFANAELFRSLPNHKEMLASLATADLCGFQTDDDVAEFLKCFHTTFGEQAKPPAAQSFPVGIDYELYANASQLKPVADHIAAYRAKYAKRRLIMSASRLDYTKGILEQLDAVDALLASRQMATPLVYKLIVAPSRENLAEYHDLKLAIADKVASINKRYHPSEPPIDYEYRDVPFDELTAYYFIADVMAVTPLRDGQNLVAKEFVAVNPDERGMLVLSRTAGASKQLTSALLVDPTNIKQITSALGEALDMPTSDKAGRHTAMRKVVQETDAFWWGRTFAAALSASRPS